MISNMLARIGIGGAKIDTKVEDRLYHPGEIVKGEFEVTGGNVTQTIRQIDLILCTKVKLDEDISFSSGDEIVILRSPNVARLEIAANQKVTIPFEVKLPIETPLTEWQGTSLRCDLYFKTELDLEGAIDALDVDRLRVGPTPEQRRILQALVSLGFHFNKAEVELGRVAGSTLFFHQEIEFYSSKRYSGKIRDLELTFIAMDYELEVILEIERNFTDKSGSIRKFGDQIIRFKVNPLITDSVHFEHQIDGLLNSRFSRTTSSDKSF